MAEPVDIDVWQGEIAELEVDAVIVAASESLFMTAGAATGVKRRAGAEVERAAVEQGPIAPGTAVATYGGDLSAPYVIHAVAVVCGARLTGRPEPDLEADYDDEPAPRPPLPPDTSTD